MNPINNTTNSYNTDSSTTESMWSKVNNCRKKVIEFNQNTACGAIVGGFSGLVGSLPVIFLETVVTLHNVTKYTTTPFVENDNTRGETVGTMISFIAAGALFGALLTKPALKCLSYIKDKCKTPDTNITENVTENESLIDETAV